MKSRRPRFYFSFRSPYSWIGARLLADRVDVVKHDVEYIPYWDPDERTQVLLEARGARFLYQQMPREKHLYLLQDIKRLTAQLGYRLQWPVDRSPWWEVPHLGYLVAERQGKGAQYLNAVYRARWEQGIDICAVETIRALAKTVGVEAESVVRAPDEPHIRELGADALYRAWQDGVFGIPFYINGFERFWGIDRFEAFVASLSRDVLVPPQMIGAPSGPTDAVAASIDESDPYDAGHPGGCG